ncbi:uncharacterized protein [Nothobranchius furzeri]|uniref:uncharacterized protein n=1 Tax=Nothobranchius furzeri TaxID=105023 RepID=UPI003904867E
MEAADPGATRELHPLRTPSFSGVVGLVSPLFSCFPAPKPLPETQLIVPCTCSDRLSSTCRRAGFPRIAPAVCPLPGPRCGAYACRFRAAAASAGSHACSCSSLPGSHAYCCSPCRVPRLLLQPLPGPTPTAAAPAGSHTYCCSPCRVPRQLLQFYTWVSRLLLQFSTWVPRLLLQFSTWVPRLFQSSPCSSPVQSMFQSCPALSSPCSSPVQPCQVHVPVLSSPRPVSESPSSLRVPVQSPSPRPVSESSSSPCPVSCVVWPYGRLVSALKGGGGGGGGTVTICPCPPPSVFKPPVLPLSFLNHTWSIISTSYTVTLLCELRYPPDITAFI